MSDVIRQSLRTLLAENTAAICHDAKLLEKLLTQDCPRFPTQVRLLVLAQKNEIVADLLALPDGTAWASASAPLVQRLQEAGRLPERDARWAVETWAVALELIPEPAQISIERLVIEARKSAPEQKPASVDLTDATPHWEKGPRVGRQPRIVWHLAFVAVAAGLGGVFPGVSRLFGEGPSYVSVVGAGVGLVGGAVGGAFGWAMGGGLSVTYLMFRGTTVPILGLAALTAVMLASGGASLALSVDQPPVALVFSMAGAAIGAWVGAKIGEALSI